MINVARAGDPANRWIVVWSARTKLEFSTFLVRPLGGLNMLDFSRIPVVPRFSGEFCEQNSGASVILEPFYGEKFHFLGKVPFWEEKFQY